MSSEMQTNAARPYLLIPMNIEALVIGKSAPDIQWVDLKPEFRYVYYNRFLGRRLEREPCDSTTSTLYPGPGVYLHWALPDGLTHGLTAKDGGQPQFPLIPNRWLILRLWDPGGPNGEMALETKAWILESDTITDDENAAVWPDLRSADLDPENPKNYYVFIGKQFKLADWPGETGAAGIDIDACGYGDAAFAAYYPACRGILTFHDKDLPDFQDGLDLAYFVAGWYSAPAKDPLSALPAAQTFAWLEDFLNEKKWTYPAFDAAQEKVKAVRDLQTRLTEARDMAARLTQRRTVFAARRPVFSHTRQVDDQLQSAQAELEKEISSLEEQLRTRIPEMNALQQELPGQILCHGIISGVRWQTRETAYDSGVPRGKSFSVAVGNSAMEALSALFKEQLDPSLVRLLEAFQYDLMQDFEQPGGSTGVDYKIHARTFSPLSRGLQWDLIQESEPQQNSEEEKSPPVPGEIRMLLEQLNHRQREINRLIRERDSARSELYAAWYKKALNAGQDPVRDGVLTRRLADLQHLIGTFTDQIAESTDADTGRPQGAAWDRLQIKLAEFLPGWKLQQSDEPRFWRPNDPVVLLAGNAFQHSSRHGEDGRYRTDGRLLCRLSGQEITRIKIAIPHTGKGDVEFGPAALDQWCRPFAGAPKPAVPLPIEDLFREFLFLTLDSKRAHAVAAAAFEKKQPGLSGRYPGAVDELAHGLLDIYLKKLWEDAGKPDARLANLRRMDGSTAWEFVGTFPSPIVINTWRKNPWLPLFLQWQVSWLPACPEIPQAMQNWQLAATSADFTWQGGAPDAQAAAKTVFAGTTLLTPKAAWHFSERLRHYNLAHDNQKLKEFQTRFGAMNLLCQSLGGFTESLLMRKSHLELRPLEPGQAGKGPQLSPIFDAVADIDWLSPLTDSNFFPVRAGHLKVEKLWIVDAFGQLLKLEDEADGHNVGHPLCPDRLSGAGGYLRFEPRLSQPTRLTIQWLPAERWEDLNPKEALPDQADEFNPVCGWILFNFLDRSLMIYDSRGNALGALQAVKRKSWAQGAGARLKDIESFHWIDIPGSEGFFFGTPPEKIHDPLGAGANPHLREFVKGLLSLKEGAGQAFGRLLEKMNESLSAAGGSGTAQNPNLALLIGKPLALVRASIRLELDGQIACAQGWKDLQACRTGGIEKVKFPVRLGDRRKWNDDWLGDDGLVGFFLNRNYRQFYPAFGLEDHDDSYSTFGMVPQVSLDEALDLTLLMDPARGICVTSGILPRKIFNLPYGDLIETLENKQVVFFTGPLVSTADEIRMPRPADVYGQWSWTHHPEVKVWQENTITDVQKEQGRFFENPLQISEGWLKLITAPLAIRVFKIKGKEPVRAEEKPAEKGGHPFSAQFAVSAGETVVLQWVAIGAEEIELKKSDMTLLKSNRHPLPTQYQVKVDQPASFTLSAAGRTEKSTEEPDHRKEITKTILITIEP